MNSKHNILIDATGGSNWIGGLYYKKNFLFSLLKNEWISSKFAFVLITEEENIEIFECFNDNIKIVRSYARKHTSKQLEILWTAIRYRCKYIFPTNARIFNHSTICPIHWIADFQHNRIPELFSEEERYLKCKKYSYLAKDPFPIVLSSNDAYQDFMKFYKPRKKNIFVVHFVSAIESELLSVNESYEQEILLKFGLKEKKYACVMNQFWQHKNHKVVLEAMCKYYQDNPDSNFQFVFTGKLDDYRSPEYISEIRNLFEQDEVKKHSKLLGFIDRVEQLVIMKNSEFVIQPSLFEGWGTVVEDAKVLDKTILLSDIPVHREQMNPKCKLFNPYNYQELADLIKKEIAVGHKDNMEQGIIDMCKRALEYSNDFEKLLTEQEGS